MDNLTHTLIGLAAGQAATKLRARRDPQGAERARVALWTASCIANNLPDLDFLYARITEPSGYLLHHRGHTHTIGLMPVLTLVVLAIMMLLRRWGPGYTKTDWRWLAAVSFLGVLSHVAFDFLNSYGVHPFWPVSSRWFYGDSIFIVEPWLWIILAPTLFFDARSRPSRLFLAAIPIFGVGLALATGYVPREIVALLALAGLAVAGLGKMIGTRFGSGVRIAAGWGASLLFILLFALASARVKYKVTGEIARNFPSAMLLDLAATPLPANPICWNVHATGTEGDAYFVKRASVSLFPRMLTASQCPNLRFGRSSFFRAPLDAQTFDHLAWQGEFRAPLAELRKLAMDCRVSAFLKFARVPAWRVSPSGEVLLVDLRFDRGDDTESGRGNFTRLALSPESAPRCPRFVPPWTAPRLELLENR